MDKRCTYLYITFYVYKLGKELWLCENINVQEALSQHRGGANNIIYSLTSRFTFFYAYGSCVCCQIDHVTYFWLLLFT